LFCNGVVLFDCCGGCVCLCLICGVIVFLFCLCLLFVYLKNITKTTTTTNNTKYKTDKQISKPSKQHKQNATQICVLADV